MTADIPNVVDQENGDCNPEEKLPPPAFIHFMNITNTLTHLMLGAVAILAICYAIFLNEILSNLGTGNTLSTHIYLCVCGYIILMSQAVLSLNPYNGWTYGFKHPQKRVTHWVMQICGSALAIVGSIIRINDVNTNFQTAHGILGLIALIFTVISLIGGILNLFLSKIRPSIFKIFHSIIGTLTLTVAYLSLCFAFHDNRLFGDTNATLAIILTVLTLLGVILSACVNTFRRILRC